MKFLEAFNSTALFLGAGMLISMAVNTVIFIRAKEKGSLYKFSFVMLYIMFFAAVAIAVFVIMTHRGGSAPQGVI